MKRNVKNHGQAEYHHALKGKNLCQVPYPGLEPETSRLWSECVTNWAILPNKKLRKNDDNIYFFCCSTNVCQFDIPLQHCSIHIITHCWTPQVGQFGHPRQHCMINYDVMLDQQCSSIWLQPMILLRDNWTRVARQNIFVTWQVLTQLKFYHVGRHCLEVSMMWRHKLVDLFNT